MGLIAKGLLEFKRLTAMSPTRGFGLMATLRTVDQEALRPLLAGLVSLTWPVTREDLAGLVAPLGWDTIRERSKGMDFRSGLPVTPDRANALFPGAGEDVGELQAYLSDRAETKGRHVAAAYKAVVAEVVAIMGAPTAESTTRSRTCWDLASGARVAIERLDHVVILDVLSPRYADTERGEERMSIDPDRVVSIGPQRIADPNE